MEEVIRNHEGVLSGFGTRLPISQTDQDRLERFAAVLIPAKLHGTVSRLVIVSTAFLFKDTVLPPAHVLGRFFFPGVVTDPTAMEETIVNSGLDWTIVRPPQLRINRTPASTEYARGIFRSSASIFRERMWPVS
jgi:hypothetical protein